MIRVLLVDDHKLVRAGLESLLSAAEDMDVVGAAADGAEAVELALLATPDVVLMDLSMPPVGSWRLCPLDPRAARTLLGARHERRAVGDLTDREREVLTLVAKGLANKQIARSLGISERTVKAHLTSVFQRIGVTDRTSAALWATRHRLVAEGGR